MSYIFKAVGPSSAPDARRVRHVLPQRTVFVVGKLTKDARDHVCRVRNISDGGVGIEHAMTLAVDDSVTIEMRGLDPVSAIVRWVDGPLAGLEFVDAVVVESVTEDVGRANGRVLRSPRFAVAHDLTLQVEDREIVARSVDLALGGIKIAAPCEDFVGKTATVVLAQHDKALKGRICWASADAFGLRFAVPLATADLAALLSAPGEADATG